MDVIGFGIPAQLRIPELSSVVRRNTGRDADDPAGKERYRYIAIHLSITGSELWAWLILQPRLHYIHAATMYCHLQHQLEGGGGDGCVLDTAMPSPGSSAAGGHDPRHPDARHIQKEGGGGGTMGSRAQQLVATDGE